jgi:hypothetical protein
MKGMAHLDVVACKRNENENQDYNQTNKTRVGERGGKKPMDMDKLKTKDLALKHTSMRA